MLQWTSSSGATSYKVYRSNAEFGTYTLITTISSLSYTEAVTEGSWWYYIKAHNNDGDSGASNKKHVDVILSPVSELFTYILSVDIQAGKDYTGEGNINNLEDLISIDENKYEIEGVWDSSLNAYSVEVNFLFGADLSNFPLDYYDLFLFLEIDPLNIQGASLQFQGYSSYSWNTIHSISDSGVSLSRHFLARTTKFRIIGSTNAQQGTSVVKIDQMRIVIAHDGNIGTSLEINNCITDYELLHKNPASNYVEDGSWWEDSDENVIGTYDTDLVFWGAASALAESQVRLFIELPEQGTVTGFRRADIVSRYFYQSSCMSMRGSPPYTGYSYAYIKNLDSGTWQYKRSHGYSGALVEVEDSWTIGGTNLDNSFIDYNSIRDAYFFDLRFYTYAWINWWAFAIQFAGAEHYIDEIDCSLEVEGYGFENRDYPEFIEINRITDYKFQINPIGNYFSSSIDSVEFLVQDDLYYSGWSGINEIDGIWNLELDRYDYNNGSYNLWIRARDENGFSTYDCYSLEIRNQDSPLYWEGPIGGDTIIFNCTTIETSDAIFDMYVYIDEDYFDEEIKLYIDNGFGERVDRTPPGGLVNGKNTVNLEPYSHSINGNIIAIIESTDIFGITQSDSRNFIFRKMISAEVIEYDRGVEFIGNQLYAIIYDPNGDRSWASLALTETHSFLFELDLSTSAGIKYEPKEFEVVGYHFSLNVERNENLIRIDTQTIDTSAITSTTTWDATTTSTGPGRGDTYWGEAIYMPYYTRATKAEFFGAEGAYEYINPTLHYGLNFTGEIIGGPNEVPSEWLAQNYVLQAEENGGVFPESADITWSSPIDGGLGIYTVFGGGRDLVHSHSEKQVTDFNEKSAAIDIHCGPILGPVRLNIGFKFKWHNRSETTETITRRYHMEDFDYYDDVEKGDMITNRIGIDNRFGTYIFETISDACFTSDPWEYNTNDWRPPLIGMPDIELDSNNDGVAPCADDTPIVIVDIEDESGIQSAYIKYSIDGGFVWNTAPLIEYPSIPGTWEGNIPSYPKGTNVLWFIEAIDLFENKMNRTDGWGDPFSYMVLNKGPQITLLTPGDATSHYDFVSITWSAEDLDNDNLIFTLSYTTDGVTKHLIESDLTGFSYDWDISTLGSIDVLIIIEVNDGTDSDEDRNEYLVYLNP